MHFASGKDGGTGDGTAVSGRYLRANPDLAIAIQAMAFFDAFPLKVVD